MAVLAVILCGLYPLVVWVLAQGLFPGQANGSLIARDGVVVGSRLIGQGFTARSIFIPVPRPQGRATTPPSGGSNLGPLSKNLIETVRRRVAEYRARTTLPRDARSLPMP